MLSYDRRRRLVELSRIGDKVAIEHLERELFRDDGALDSGLVQEASRAYQEGIRDENIRRDPMRNDLLSHLNRRRTMLSRDNRHSWIRYRKEFYTEEGISDFSGRMKRRVESMLLHWDLSVLHDRGLVRLSNRARMQCVKPQCQAKEAPLVGYTHSAQHFEHVLFWFILEKYNPRLSIRIMMAIMIGEVLESSLDDRLSTFRTACRKMNSNRMKAIYESLYDLMSYSRLRELP